MWRYNCEGALPLTRSLHPTTPPPLPLKQPQLEGVASSTRTQRTDSVARSALLGTGRHRYRVYTPFSHTCPTSSHSSLSLLSSSDRLCTCRLLWWCYTPLCPTVPTARQIALAGCVSQNSLSSTLLLAHSSDPRCPEPRTSKR
jgi:hypothetical protein